MHTWSSRPGRFRRFGSLEGLEGRELLAGDLMGGFGHATALVADLNAGVNVAEELDRVALQDSYLIVAARGEDLELWAMEQSGSTSLRLLPGASLSSMHVAAGYAYIALTSGGDSTGRHSLLSSDGTVAGTRIQGFRDFDHHNFRYAGLSVWQQGDTLFAQFDTWTQDPHSLSELLYTNRPSSNGDLTLIPGGGGTPRIAQDRMFGISQSTSIGFVHYTRRSH